MKSWTSAPALQSPTHGALMVHPTHPLVLRWSTVPRAGEVHRLDRDRSLARHDREPEGRNVRNGLRAPLDALVEGTYYWGVRRWMPRGIAGRPRRCSRSSGLADEHQRLGSTTCSLRRRCSITCSWDSVAGAARYELEINPTEEFAPGSKVCCASPVIGSSYAPTVVFKDNVYYWRVRALDTREPGRLEPGPDIYEDVRQGAAHPGPSIKNLRMRDNLSDPGATPMR